MGAAAAQGSECDRVGEVWAGHEGLGVIRIQMILEAVRQGKLGVQKERREGIGRPSKGDKNQL